ncbi:hypothetical protein KPSA1_07371 [Pseudomonas syringae pv. actinidiae]|uniref:Uncharacterized protein n=1 Tax=Pseudomonas syringae pv. actinidiae TaxID=103796 RepID=A0A2V0QM06_PSESF|nr:hypothetical protein KPSA1_07371 [Pseudomonas syringae pv. actinidiae]
MQSDMGVRSSRAKHRILRGAYRIRKKLYAKVFRALVTA